MGVSRSLMSKAVDHLVRGGWIETKPDQNDRRMVHLVLLPKAEPAVKRCRELKHEYYEKMCAGISPEDMQVFHRVMEQIRRNLENFNETGRYPEMRKEKTE